MPNTQDNQANKTLWEGPSVDSLLPVVAVYPLKLADVKLDAVLTLISLSLSRVNMGLTYLTTAVISRLPTLRLFHSPAILMLVITFNSLACESGKAPAENSPTVYGYQIVHTWPHDRDAFTQGLVFNGGNFLESTGEVGRSTLRRVGPETGAVVQKVDVPPPYFAEGITLLKGKIYQLTWQHQLGFVYDALTFEKTGEFKYTGEGWGLANDGQSLILSDGTNRIRFLDPDNFQVTKTIAVLDGHTAVVEINELEYVQGELYANIWHDDRIARIDPKTGKVVGWINLAGLLARGEVQDEEAVLNGIAYDEAGGRLFVTGKLWPKLFEITLKAK
jgi:glutamine cyclotransferase